MHGAKDGQRSRPTQVINLLRFSFFSGFVVAVFHNTIAHSQAYVLEMTIPCYSVKGRSSLCHLLALGFLGGPIFFLFWWYARLFCIICRVVAKSLGLKKHLVQYILCFSTYGHLLWRNDSLEWRSEAGVMTQWVKVLFPGPALLEK